VTNTESKLVAMNVTNAQRELTSTEIIIMSTPAIIGSVIYSTGNIPVRNIHKRHRDDIIPPRATL